MQETCSRCGSNKIIPPVPLSAPFGDLGTPVRTQVQVSSAPQAWWFKDIGIGELFVRICGECGYADLQVSNYRKLYEKFERSQRPADSGAEDGPG